MNTRSAKILTVESAEGDANSMAGIADVLTELKALRSEFGSKLDGINKRLDVMANSISALESNLSDIKQDVSANEKRIGEAEARIAVAEDQINGAESALISAAKRIAELELKTDDLENRGRRKNIRLFGLKEGAEGRRPLLDFMNDMLPRWLELGSEKEAEEFLRDTSAG